MTQHKRKESSERKVSFSFFSSLLLPINSGPRGERKSGKLGEAYQGRRKTGWEGEREEKIPTDLLPFPPCLPMASSPPPHIVDPPALKGSLVNFPSSLSPSLSSVLISTRSTEKERKEGEIEGPPAYRSSGGLREERERAICESC